MRKLNLWIIPAVFFALCCALNLAGCACSETLERIIKPSLMPLLSLATFTYLLEAAGLRPGALETCHPRHRKREGPFGKGSEATSAGCIRNLTVLSHSEADTAAVKVNVQDADVDMLMKLYDF